MSGICHISIERQAGSTRSSLDGWKVQLCAEVEAAKRRNLQAHVAALKAKSRKKEARQVLEKGLVDPWKRGRHGPLREGILTVIKSWFGGTGFDEWNPKRVAQFRATALAFLKQHFPDGQLRYACGHADEEAYHIHFVVAVWRDRVTVNRGRQSLLQSSINPLLADYEHAQTVAGQAFKPLGITRGERRAEARRLASAAGEPVPEKRRHTPPSEWRAKQRAQAQTEASEILENAVGTAHAEVENGRSLGKAAIRKSRKRAVSEARKRKEDAAREVAAQARAKDKLTREAEQMRTAAIEAEAKRVEAEQERATAELPLSDIVSAETEKVQDLKAAQATEAEMLRKLTDGTGEKTRAARKRCRVGDPHRARGNGVPPRPAHKQSHFRAALSQPHCGNRTAESTTNDDHFGPWRSHLCFPP
ncbi:hypothetical protein DC363_06170 [Thalassorhabdomicrobium marinisediminis]|uniref:Plasmid recombination enzyme n=1 Tax=Thalassorhabdomicrobium marinisediminis TaxID=2170577 RepID=A0A2T7FZ23_9RHOB|nr:hypothetical protein DC363_06170 [Thalassorhabdomicrobium marinisediminis]